MDKILAIACFITCLLISLTIFPDGAVSMLLVLFLSAFVFYLIRQQKSPDAIFLQRVFVVGLLLRVLFGAYIHYYDQRAFFGNDANLYDAIGYRLYLIWFEGYSRTQAFSVRALDMSLPGWGMDYAVGFLYTIIGRNILAAQYVCAVVGAATAPLVYACAHKVFSNRQVGRTCAILVAVSPSFVIWSGQLLKDGLIIFLLVLCITMVLRLQQKFNYADIALLVFAMGGILSLRFYIFYMVAIAVVGSFIIGSTSSTQSIIKRVIAVILVGLSLAYLGALRNAGENLDEYASLERIQKSRQDLSTSESGFGQDTDVSTTEGAVTALPVGFAYLMFAPFPWQVSNFRQSIAVPEVIFWWSMMPFLAIGLIYTFKYRFRNAVAILLFTFLLTIAYSIFQGNIGTAYRQRTQIQVFLYMFIGAGWTLRRERQQNKKLEFAHARRQAVLRQQQLREKREQDQREWEQRWQHQREEI